MTRLRPNNTKGTEGAVTHVVTVFPAARDLRGKGRKAAIRRMA